MRPLSFLATAAAVAALFAAPAANAQDFKLYGVNYNIRAGPDAAPQETKCKKADQIARELAILKNVTDIVRLYSLIDCDQSSAAIPAIFAAGLKLELGLWVGKDNAVYADERERFKQLIQDKKLINNDNVVSIHVGSEAIYREDVDAATAISNFKEIKQIATDAGLTVPISIGDIGDTYIAYPELFEAVDYVSANLFPFWEKVEADKAADQFYTRYQKVADAAAKYNKKVVIGETGWASNGTHAGASEASPENAARFFSDFYKLAEEHDLEYYYFAAFDESWKLQYEKSDSTVEGYFGLFTAEGVLKPEYASLKLDSVLEPRSGGSAPAPAAGGSAPAPAPAAGGSAPAPAAGAPAPAPAAGGNTAPAAGGGASGTTVIITSEETEESEESEETEETEETEDRSDEDGSDDDEGSDGDDGSDEDEDDGSDRGAVDADGSEADEPEETEETEEPEGTEPTEETEEPEEGETAEESESTESTEETEESESTEETEESETSVETKKLAKSHGVNFKVLLHNN